MTSNIPPTLKGITNYIKIANENASRDPVVYYWCLFYAVQMGMQLDKKSPDALQFITSLLGTLEGVKKQLAANDAITNEIVAQSHLEMFAWKLFKYADEKEKTGAVDKGVVHAFFTAGYIFDVLSLFGEVDEGIANTKKYAKWKCMQINKCLKDGTRYIPSTDQKAQQEEDDELLRELTAFGTPTLVPPPAKDINSFEHDYKEEKPQVPHHSNADAGYAARQPPVPPPPSSHQYIPPPMAQAPQPVSPSPSTHSAPAGGVKQPTMEEFVEARKYIKYALSAVDFEDTKAVIDNLHKALRLMQS